MASRVLLSPNAQEFVDNLRRDFREVWEYQVLWQLVDNPFNLHTIRSPLADDPAVLATIIGPFGIRFRISEDGEVAEVNWTLGVRY